MTMSELIETLKAEGWTFGRQCGAYVGCTMEIHGFKPDGSPVAVKDEAALDRYFGTPEKRQALSTGATA